MCSECWQTPCHPRCPNAPDPKVRGYCEKCKRELRDDYEYYTDNDDNIFCSYECALEHYDIRPKDWDYE